MFVYLCSVPPNDPKKLCGRNSYPDFRSFRKWSIDKEIHPLQQELQTTVITSLSVKQFSASLSLSKPRYAKHFTGDNLRAVAVHE